jgi:soluble cytochrome b562
MPPKKKSLKRGAASEETTTAIATEEQTESHKKPKVAKKSGAIKLDGFKEFSANAAKQLKAHCGAGRVEAARVALQKHGCEL